MHASMPMLAARPPFSRARDSGVLAVVVMAWRLANQTRQVAHCKPPTTAQVSGAGHGPGPAPPVPHLLPVLSPFSCRLFSSLACFCPRGTNKRRPTARRAGPRLTGRMQIGCVSALGQLLSACGGLLKLARGRLHRPSTRTGVPDGATIVASVLRTLYSVLGTRYTVHGILCTLPSVGRRILGSRRP